VVQRERVVESSSRLERVYEAQHRKLWRALVGYCGDPDVASDAVSEAFAQALARGDDLRDAEAWVWRVSFRLAGRELQRRRRERSGATERPPYDLPEPLSDVIAALARISPNQRLAVVLHDYADRPTSEIAALLGASRATVHVHLSQGRKRLRKMLEADDG
jgi:RNA polymerase sigma-70 factor, ECF subfamily